MQKIDFDKLPAVLEGMSRQWVKCTKCSQIAWYDYIPYGLGNPILTLPCGHGSGDWNRDAVSITEDSARFICDYEHLIERLQPRWDFVAAKMGHGLTIHVAAGYESDAATDDECVEVRKGELVVASIYHTGNPDDMYYVGRVISMETRDEGHRADHYDEIDEGGCATMAKAITAVIGFYADRYLAAFDEQQEEPR